MGLFKGDTSPERVEKAIAEVMAGKPAVGIGGQVTVDQDWVTIDRKGAAAKMIRGSGQKRIPLASVTAVDIKEPGATNGYITFSILGGSASPKGIQLAQKDENSVVFSRNHVAEFMAVKQLVEQRILENANRSSAPVAAAPQIDVADQLAKLAALKDQGILSEEEFAAQKAKLLS